MQPFGVRVDQGVIVIWSAPLSPEVQSFSHKVDCRLQLIVITRQRFLKSSINKNMFYPKLSIFNFCIPLNEVGNSSIMLLKRLSNSKFANSPMLGGTAASLL